MGRCAGRTFPDEVPANVQVEATAIVDEAPAGAYFIMMTHDHSLDFSLTQRIMRRELAASKSLCGVATNSTSCSAR